MGFTKFTSRVPEQLGPLQPGDPNGGPYRPLRRGGHRRSDLV